MLKNLTLKVLRNRLKLHTIIPELGHYKQLREELLKIRLKKSKLNKQVDWSMKELEKTGARL